MAYQTGTATSPTDLLQQLVTFLTNNGWTSNMSQADGAGWRAHLAKGGLYINLRANMSEAGSAVWGNPPQNNTNQYTLNAYTGTGFSSGSNWRSQAGGPIGVGVAYTIGAVMNTGLATVTYFFFQDAADNVIVVVERTAGAYVYIGWGPSINKVGSWTGGMYCFGPHRVDNPELMMASPNGPGFCPFHNGFGGTQQINNAFVRADVDAFTGKYLAVGRNTSGSQPGRGVTGKLIHSSVPGINDGGNEDTAIYSTSTEFPHYAGSGTGAGFSSRLTSAFNARANLLPILLWAQRDAGGWSLLGTVPSIFRTNGVGQGFSPASVYTVGPDNYMMFPHFAVKKL